MCKPPLPLPHAARALAAALLSATATLLPGTALAALDVNANTDDRSINVRTPWWTYAEQTPQQLTERLAEHDARIAGLEVNSVGAGGEPRFTVRLVPNSGAYALPAWWWVYDQTPAQLSAQLAANSARLIELERYDRGGGQIRYAAVLVANSGAAARQWSYLLGATRGQIGNHIGATGARPIDLDAHGSGNARRYDAVFVRNTGSDQRGFDWDTGLTPEQIASRTEAFNGRVVKLGRDSDGRYLFIQVKNNGSNASAWWHRYGVASLAELAQYAHQMRARPVHVASRATSAGRRFDVVLIDNANAEERRMRGWFAPFVDAAQNPRGIFEAYLKEVGGPVLIDLNGQRPAETASALKVLHLLHSLRQVQAGADSLAAANFAFYDYHYPDHAEKPKDRCPFPSQENVTPYLSTLEWGLDQMMKISDNRTTRGVVLRYGGSYAPFNATAAAAGLAGTLLRHDIGCSYYDTVTERHSPATRRNLTTAADLASIYEGVWRRTLLGDTNRARAEFLESVRAESGATDELRVLINQEAATLDKRDRAPRFRELVQTWGKGGSYGACIPTAERPEECGTSVLVLANAGIVRLPVGEANGMVAFRHYVFGSLISDVPYTSDAEVDDHAQAYRKARRELFRSVVREALASF